MKKMILVVSMMLISMVLMGTGIAHAFDVERLELDLSTPTNFSRQALNVMSSYQNWTLSSDIRLNVLRTAVGKIGVEASPVYDFRSNVIHSSLGVYYEPFKYIQIHADHINDFDTTHLSSNSLKGSDLVGIRLVLINR